MSEVKRYLIQKTPIGTMMKPNPEGNWVASEDFDRVTAELVSANSDKEAYAQNAIDLRKRVDALQALLTAADERVDVMTTALSRIQFRCQSFVESDWAMAVESVEAVLSIAEAALKPAEGGGDDA